MAAQGCPYELKAALLATAVTLASPYQFVYDLPVLTIAQAFLLRHVARTTAIAGHRYRGARLWSTCCVFMFADTAVPLGVFGSLTLLASSCCTFIRALIVANRVPAHAATHSGKPAVNARADRLNTGQLPAKIRLCVCVEGSLRTAR